MVMEGQIRSGGVAAAEGALPPPAVMGYGCAVCLVCLATKLSLLCKAGMGLLGTASLLQVIGWTSGGLSPPIPPAVESPWPARTRGAQPITRAAARYCSDALPKSQDAPAHTSKPTRCAPKAGRAAPNTSPPSGNAAADRFHCSFTTAAPAGPRRGLPHGDMNRRSQLTASPAAQASTPAAATAPRRCLPACTMSWQPGQYR